MAHQVTIRPLVEPVPEWTATNTLDRQIAEARKGMSAERWNALNAEWGSDLLRSSPGDVK